MVEDDLNQRCVNIVDAFLHHKPTRERFEEKFEMYSRLPCFGRDEDEQVAIIISSILNVCRTLASSEKPIYLLNFHQLFAKYHQQEAERISGEQK